MGEFFDALIAGTWEGGYLDDGSYGLLEEVVVTGSTGSVPFYLDAPSSLTGFTGSEWSDSSRGSSVESVLDDVLQGIGTSADIAELFSSSEAAGTVGNVVNLIDFSIHMSEMYRGGTMTQDQCNLFLMEACAGALGAGASITVKIAEWLSQQFIDNVVTPSTALYWEWRNNVDNWY